MKLNVDTLEETLDEYKKLVKILMTCQTQLRTISTYVTANWEGEVKELFVFGFESFLAGKYESCIFDVKGIKGVLKDSYEQANCILNRCDGLVDLLDASNQTMPNYFEKRTKGGKLLLEKEKISDILRLSDEIGFTDTSDERKKLKQAVDEISFCDSSTLNYSSFDMNADKIMLETYLQNQSDCLADFAQSVRMYQQEIETLEEDAVRNFAQYTNSAGKETSRKMYQPAMNKKGEFNKDRIYYLMHTPIESMSEEEFKELTETYTTLAEKQDYKSMEEFLECCYEYDEDNLTNKTTFKLTSTYYIFSDCLENALKEAGKNKQLNLMERNCYDKEGNEIYNDATKKFLKQLEAFAILKGLQTHQPTISYKSELFKKKNTELNRNKIEINLSKNRSVNNFEVNINGKKIYILGWDDDHDGELDDIVIGTNNSLKRDKKEEIKQYFLDMAKGIVTDKIVDQAAKKVPGAGQVYQAGKVLFDINNICKEIDEFNSTLDSQNRNLELANIWNYLGIRVCASAAEGENVQVDYADLDPVETRARIAWAKSEWKKKNLDKKEKGSFGLKEFYNIYKFGSWENIPEESKSKYYEKAKKDKREKISSIDDLF